MAKPFPVLGPNRKWVMDDQRIRNRLMQDLDSGLVTLDLGKDNVFYLFRQYQQGLQAFHHVGGDSLFLIAGQLTLAYMIGEALKTLAPDTEDATIDSEESENE